MSKMNKIHYDELYPEDLTAYTVTIEGSQVLSREAFLKTMEKIFKFPSSCEGLLARYNDWITDLEWILSDNIVLIINHFEEFLKYSPDFKQYVMERFEKYILPFWEIDVTKYVVGGQPRKFNIYCFTDTASAATARSITR